MRYHHTPAIPGYGDRLWIENDHGCRVAEDLQEYLTNLSMWKGIDKRGENFISFEFGPKECEKAKNALANSLYTLDSEFELRF